MYLLVIDGESQCEGETIIELFSISKDCAGTIQIYDIGNGTNDAPKEVYNSAEKSFKIPLKDLLT